MTEHKRIEADDPAHALALAVLRQAVADARFGRPDAVAWLKDKGNPVLSHFDITDERVTAALERRKKRR